MGTDGIRIFDESTANWIVDDERRSDFESESENREKMSRVPKSGFYIVFPSVNAVERHFEGIAHNLVGQVRIFPSHPLPRLQPKPRTKLTIFTMIRADLNAKNSVKPVHI